jgi:hypothetical protein
MTGRRYNLTITAAQLRELLSYDPEIGQFYWRVTRNGNCKAGALAGYLMKQGYWCIMLRGKSYLAHRLAWLYTTGEWPAQLVDHINGDKADNRFANLREASEHGNTWNRKREGVHRRRNGRFGSAISPNGRRIYLGTFDTAEEARAAYRAATIEHYGDFSIAHREDAA